MRSPDLSRRPFSLTVELKRTTVVTFLTLRISEPSMSRCATFAFGAHSSGFAHTRSSKRAPIANTKSQSSTA